MCTSWFLLFWRQHLKVGAVGCGSGQLSASAERSLAWTIGPALIAELSGVPSPSLARGSAPCAFFVSVLVGFFFFLGQRAQKCIKFKNSSASIEIF